MFKPLLIGCVLGAVALGALAGENQPAAGAEELIQYVLDAKKAGLKDSVIEENAEVAGWRADIVKNAVTYVNSTRSPAKTAIASASGAPQGPAVAVAPATPAAPPAASTRNSGSNPKDRGVPDDYVIGAGDVISILVWKEPDASVSNAVVRPDGKVSMPLLKDVQVAGLTPAQGETLITGDLSKYINAPDVTIIVSGINSKKIYVTGAIRKEGPISYTYRMTILQAISEAGGLNEYAKRKKIYVLRYENGRQYKFQFDYDAVLKGEHMEENIPLAAGDTIVVPH